MSNSIKLSKASKGRTWLQNGFVDMRAVDIAYHSTLESLAYALSNEKVDWLLSPVAGWKVVLNTPIECGVHPISGEIVGRHQLWNCAEKARWMADPEVYGHIQTKAYVEHPYEKQHTKDLIKQGVLAACSRGISVRAIAVQVADIIDARLDCVLLPRDPDNDQAHSVIHSLIGTNKDGMVQKYGQIALVDHNTNAKLTPADLQKADDDMKLRVEAAMTTLTGAKWVFPGSSVAAMSKPMVTITQPKTINAATTLQRVTWADFEIALTSLGWRIDRPTSSNERTCGWHGVFKSVPHKAALPSGDFVTQGKRFLLAQMDRADFESAVNTLVQLHR